MNVNRNGALLPTLPKPLSEATQKPSNGDRLTRDPAIRGNLDEGSDIQVRLLTHILETEAQALKNAPERLAYLQHAPRRYKE